MIGRPWAGIRALRHFARLERQKSGGTIRPSLLRRGFFSDKASLYPFADYPDFAFLTDWEIETRLGNLNDARDAAILGDKLLFHEAALRAGLAMPELVATRIDDVLTVFSPSDEKGETLIAKPCDGRGGTGVLQINELDAVPKDGAYIVERNVPAHDYGHRIFPDALNTIRVLMAAQGERPAVILGAAHRFATSISAPTDNVSAGGLVSRINIRTGLLSAALGRHGGRIRTLLDRHPETGTSIKGVIVPTWRDVLDLAKRATDAFPGLRYVGWDIAITPGGPLLIEGNAGLPNPNILQAHEPLLLEAQVADAFLALGVISRRKYRKIVRYRDGQSEKTV